MSRIYSFKSKLLLYMLIVNLISIFAIAIYGAYFIKKRNEISALSENIKKLHLNLIMDMKCQTDFVQFDAVDTLYFIDSTCTNLRNHEVLFSNIMQILDQVRRDKYFRHLDVKNEVDTLDRLIRLIDIEFEVLTNTLTRKGFKDYGIEGLMRDYAHSLERSDINSTYVLSLRRHEKDYIMRKEPQYVYKLNNLAELFLNDIINDKTLGSKTKDTLKMALLNYVVKFNELVKLDEQLGFYGANGSIQQLEMLKEDAELLIENIINKAGDSSKSMLRNLELYSLIFISTLSVIMVFLSFYLSKKITSPLRTLAVFISDFTRNNFIVTEYPVFDKQVREIGIIEHEFRTLMHQLKIREDARNLAETALRENEQKYRNLADLLPQSVFETDEKCQLTYFNKTFSDTFGYIDTDDIMINEIVSSQCDNLFSVAEAAGIDCTARKRDGSTIPVLLYVSRIYNNNNVSGLRGIIVDITEKVRYTEELQKQKIKAEQADRLKSSFLANMSHEIRTPMNSIVGFSQIITEPGIDDETKLEYAGYIRNSSDLLLKIINDVLDIARIESGQFKISRTLFDLNALMNNISIQAREIKKAREKKSIEIRISKHYENGGFIISCDPHRLEQVIINLVSNAIKFTNEGTIEIGYVVRDNHVVEFYVKDTGIGIEEDKLDFVFERFTQIEDTNSKQVEGTGIGLSICKSIVEMLDGRIWVESVPGYGSIFSFELPIPMATRLSDGIRVNQSRYDYEILKGVKLLIAEDVDYNFLFLKEGLRHLDMDIIRASNGREAVNIADNLKDLKLILMDMRMPEMDGYTAARIIKSSNPTISIIATTANAMIGEKEKCLESGCDYYISKPIRLDLLIEKIAYYFHKQHSELMPS